MLWHEVFQQIILLEFLDFMRDDVVDIKYLHPPSQVATEQVEPNDKHQHTDVLYLEFATSEEHEKRPLD